MPDIPPNRTTIVPTLAELVERIDRITDAVNDLRNRVQGRGVVPAGPIALADKVNEAQTSWQAQRAKLLDRNYVGLHPLEATDSLEHWEKLVNGLISEAGAAGLLGEAWQLIPVTHRAQGAEEIAIAVEHNLESAATTISRGLVVIVVGVLGVWLAKSYFEGRGRR